MTELVGLCLSDIDGNPNCWFSQAKAQIISMVSFCIGLKEIDCKGLNYISVVFFCRFERDQRELCRRGV